MDSSGAAAGRAAAAAAALVCTAVTLGALVASAPGCGGAGRGDAAPAEPGWVTSARCAECHPEQTEAWRGSHHDLAMQEATEETVLGDFSGVTFEHLGATTRFFRRDGRYFVEAEGPDGERGEFPVRYTFGVEPLQQVLVELPGGWIQALTVAWDVAGGRWFTLYPEERHAVVDPLHWTGRYQSWNGMCGECHSTGLRKGYDRATDTFATTFEEIDVACEACHGPGEEHVAWAERAGTDVEYATLEPADIGLAVALRRGAADTQLDTCAACHARRTPLHGEPLPGGPFLDDYVPELLRPGSYFADGQIDGEVYVYGSFVQSKMHAAGVACTDCHDPHSLELLTPRNSLCAQCHSPHAPLERFPTLTAKDYDTPEHHHHEPGTPGAACVSCHMPERTYMQVDPRRDHSFRVPRPDLSAELGTPNACNACHDDRDAAWAADAVETWYGGERAPHFATTIARARAGDPASFDGLIEIARDPERPAILRATALELLRGYPELGHAIGAGLLSDDAPLVRQAAANALEGADLQTRMGTLLGLLDDPVRAVRMEAARQLVGVPRVGLLDRTEAFDRALAEWVAAQEASAEMPWARLNLASLRRDQGDAPEAAAELRRALEMDPYFLPARFNLATLHNSTGRNLEAERVLREGIELHPDEGELHYSLGLLLAEVGRLPDAASSLLRASELLPNRPRVLYNAGLALKEAGRAEEAERALLESDRLRPDDPDVVHALALLYEEEGSLDLAASMAERLVRLAPEAPFAQELRARIDEAREAAQ